MKTCPRGLLSAEVVCFLGLDTELVNLVASGQSSKKCGLFKRTSALHKTLQ